MSRIASLLAVGVAVLALGAPVATAASTAGFTAGPTAGPTAVPAALPAQGTFAPVTVSVAGRGNVPVVLGSDARYHVVYEIALTNTRPVPATIQRVAVVDSAFTSLVVQEWSGDELRARLRTLSGEPVADTVIEPNGQRLVLVDLVPGRRRGFPGIAAHQVDAVAQVAPGSREVGPTSTIAAPVELTGTVPRALRAPVRGNGWVVVNGCCTTSPYRSAVLPTEVGLLAPGRFAVDLYQLDDESRFVTGDPALLESYAGYAEDVLAVAGGTVVTVRDDAPDNPPSASVDLTTVDPGNHVILDLGDGVFVSYEHLQPGSLAVKLGDRLRRGDLIGRIGNSGTSTAPHLHFRVADAVAALGSDGLPFVISQFAYAGTVDRNRLVGEGLVGSFGEGRLAEGENRTRQLPLDSVILDLPTAGGTSQSIT